MRDRCGDKLVHSTFDDLMFNLLFEFDYPDFICSPRGMEIKEILVPRLVLTNPRARLLNYKARNVNYGFGVGEFLWYLRGSDSLEEMTYYNKRMPSFSDDGKYLNSAYGYIIFGMGSKISKEDKPNAEMGIDQWGILKCTLIDDKDSRRAILQIHHPAHQFHASVYGSKDVPCTLSLQFFIRDDELHMHVNMRSNDVHWGLTYDLFSFTLLQEIMYLELKEHYPELKLGRYIHTAGSLHIYEKHYEMTEKMTREYTDSMKKNESPSALNRGMDPLDLDVLRKIEPFEEDLRLGKINPKKVIGDLDELFPNKTVRWMAQQLVNHRMKRDSENDQ